MNKFLKNTTQTISSYNLIKSGDTIVVGVSGGADSIALLEALDHCRTTLGLKLIVCHVNHGLRKGADTDQRFVEKACAKKMIPCQSFRITIPKKSKDSIEQAARYKRFEALIKTAKRVKADSIALAHHQNDLAETVMMRMIRGSGLQGLQAIMPKRIIDTVPIIRPLIHATRDDIENFLHSKKIKFRHDPTNKNQKFLRNKIRHDLLPYLMSKYNPNINETLSNLAQTSSIDYDFLRQEGKRHFNNTVLKQSAQSIELSATKLNNKHPALQHMIIRMAIEHINGHTRTITLKHIESVCSALNFNNSSTNSLNLPLGIKIERNTTSICLRK